MLAQPMLIVALGFLSVLVGVDAGTPSSTLIRQEQTRGRAVSRSGTSSTEQADKAVANVVGQKDEKSGRQSDSNIIIVEHGDGSGGEVDGVGSDDDDVEDPGDAPASGSFMADTAHRFDSSRGRMASRSSSSSAEYTEKAVAGGDGHKGEKSERQSDSNIIIVEQEDGGGRGADDAASAGDDVDDQDEDVASGDFMADTANNEKSDGGRAPSRATSSPTEHSEKATLPAEATAGGALPLLDGKSTGLEKDTAADGRHRMGTDSVDKAASSQSAHDDVAAANAQKDGMFGNQSDSNIYLIESGDDGSRDIRMVNAGQGDDTGSDVDDADSRWETSSKERTEKAGLSAQAVEGAAPTLLEGKHIGSVQASATTTLADKEASAERAHDSVADVDDQKGQLAGSQSDSDIIIVDKNSGASEDDDDAYDDDSRADSLIADTAHRDHGNGGRAASRSASSSTEHSERAVIDLDGHNGEKSERQSDSNIIIVEHGDGSGGAADDAWYDDDDAEDLDEDASGSLMADIARKVKSNGGRAGSRAASSSTESSQKAFADADGHEGEKSGRQSDSNIIIVEHGDGSGGGADDYAGYDDDDAEDRSEDATSSSLIEDAAHKVKSNGGRADSRAASSSTESSQKAAKRTAGAAPTLLQAKSTDKVTETRAERSHGRVADMTDQKQLLAGSQSDADIIIVDKNNGDSESVDDDDEEDARAVSLKTVRRDKATLPARGTGGAEPTLLEAKSSGSVLGRTAGSKSHIALANKDSSAERAHDSVVDLDGQKDQLAGSQSDSDIIIVDNNNGESEADDDEDEEDARADSLVSQTVHEVKANGEPAASRATSSTEHSEKATERAAPTQLETKLAMKSDGKRRKREAQADKDQLAGSQEGSNIILVAQGAGQDGQADASDDGSEVDAGSDVDASDDSFIEVAAVKSGKAFASLVQPHSV